MFSRCCLTQPLEITVRRVEGRLRDKKAGEVTWCINVPSERQEGAAQGERARRLERRLRTGDYLLVNFTVDECLRNERVGVNL